MSLEHQTRITIKVISEINHVLVMRHWRLERWLLKIQCCHYRNWSNKKMVVIYLIIITFNKSNTFYNEIVPPPTTGYQVANFMVWLKSADYLLRGKKVLIRWFNWIFEVFHRHFLVFQLWTHMLSIWSKFCFSSSSMHCFCCMSLCKMISFVGQRINKCSEVP